MKKLFLILISIFMLSSLNSNAAKVKAVLDCRNGRASIVYYEYHPETGWVCLGYEVIGGCYGRWATTLRTVNPTGSQPSAELPEASYLSLNSTDPYEPGVPTAEFLNDLNENHMSFPDNWVNPFKLSAQAYAAIYGSVVMDMFYVHTSVRSTDGASMLNLYSDIDKTVNVTYKTITGTVVASEDVNVVAGSNSVELTAPSDLSDGIYNVTVTSSGSSINTTISISH